MNLVSELKSAFPFFWYKEPKKPLTLAQKVTKQLLENWERSMPPTAFTNFKAMPSSKGKTIKFRRPTPFTQPQSPV